MARTVSDIMTKHEITAQKNDTLQKVAELMNRHNIGFLPIVEDNRLIGAVTDRDLVIRGYAHQLDAHQPVYRVYTEEVISCNPNTSIEDASKLMADHQIHRLMVTENGELCGIVALADLARDGKKDEAAAKALSGISQR